MREDTLVKEFCYDDFKEFLKEEIRKKGLYKRIYAGSVIITGLAFFAAFGFGIAQAVIKEEFFYPAQLLAGLAFSFSLLIVVHELIHGVAYKMVGAKKVYFGAMLSKLIFFAASDQEKFNGVQFRFIALAPFISLLVAGVSGLLVVPQYFLFILTILFAHSFFCVGDFAVLNFMQQYELKKLYTYDSRSERKTYFYLREPIPSAYKVY